MSRMKKRLLKLFFILLFLAGSVWFVLKQNAKNGFLENRVSSISLPFSWFETSETKDVSAFAIKDGGYNSIAGVKKLLQPIIKQKDERIEKKDLRKVFDSESAKKLEELLSRVYSVQHQYVNSVGVTGFIKNDTGWHPIITLSVYGDNELIKNYSFTNSVIDETELRIISDFQTDELEYSLAELPDDFDYSIINRAVIKNENFFDKKLYKTVSLDDKLEQSLEYSENRVLSELRFSYSDSAVKLTNLIGTKEGIIRFITEQDFDNQTSMRYYLE